MSTTTTACSWRRSPASRISKSPMHWHDSAYQRFRLSECRASEPRSDISVYVRMCVCVCVCAGVRVLPCTWSLLCEKSPVARMIFVHGQRTSPKSDDDATWQTMMHRRSTEWCRDVSDLRNRPRTNRQGWEGPAGTEWPLGRGEPRRSGPAHSARRALGVV